MTIAETTRTGLVWLRRDLRLQDQAALSRATIECDRIIVTFVFDPEILARQKSEGGQRRLQFLMQSLRELDQELSSYGSALLLMRGAPATCLARACSAFSITDLFFNRDYTPIAKRRDRNVQRVLANDDISVHICKDQVVFEADEVCKQDGHPYVVFTPFAKQWRKVLEPEHVETCRVYTDRFVAADVIHSSSLQIDVWPKSNAILWLNAGRKAGVQRLEQFLAHINRYAVDRDFPALDHATSGLSVHLKFGTVGIREAVRAGLQAAANDRENGPNTWVDELIWREFYMAVTDCFPHVAVRNFKRDTEAIRWQGQHKHLEAWQQGRTGYPIVDAAMRCLSQTGWLHNRLRMIVASFLTKDLLLDWRLGERWFKAQLLDYDFAANNGGWQWAASTGCDAQPYFRIFNPVTQSQKYDPEGAFIRPYVPELKHVETDAIHWPHKNGQMKLGMSNEKIGHYPLPIVEHSVQRKKALAMYKAARNSS